MLFALYVTCLAVSIFYTISQHKMLWLKGEGKSPTCFAVILNKIDTGFLFPWIVSLQTALLNWKTWRMSVTRQNMKTTLGNIILTKEMCPVPNFELIDFGNEKAWTDFASFLELWKLRNPPSPLLHRSQPGSLPFWIEVLLVLLLLLK